MQYRRIRSRKRSSLLPTVLLGLGLGLATGLVLGEWLGGQGRKRLVRSLNPWRRRLPGRPNPSALADRLHNTLASVLGPDADTLDFVAVGREAIELHGWVPSRAARTRAVRAATATIGPSLRLVDCLLVWGEDDRPTAEMPIPDELERA